MNEQPTAYDRVPYPGNTQPSTQPDSLAVAVSLCGMRPADVERCRVLELGCGDGANLLPIAHALPGSTVVGIDLASSAIDRGNTTAQALGLTNLTLRVADLTALPDDLGGPFDYIIAHGLYSWVPQHVRDALLAACAQLLSPNGVAYVSYNAYPGHHFRHMAREMMLYVAGGIADPHEKIRTAREALATLAAARPEGEAYGTVLREEVKRTSKVIDEVFFHDTLEPTNQPFYFNQFVEHSRRHGLQFVTESEYAETSAGILYDPRTARAVTALMEMTGSRADIGSGDERRVIDREQFADFVRGRAFRRTLLCREGVPLKRPVDPREVFRLRVAGDVTPAGEVPRGGERFRNDRGLTLTTNRPLARAAFRRLGQIYPRSEPFPDLLAAAVVEAGELARHEGTAEERGIALAQSLLAAHAVSLIDFRTREPAIATRPGERPVTSSLARQQAREGAEVVTNLLGGSVRMEGALARELLLRLDGTRDNETVIRELGELIVSGAIPPAEIGQQITDAAPAAEFIRSSWDSKLRLLDRRALLVGT